MNGGASNVKLTGWVVTPFLPCNDIGLMLKFEIMGGVMATPKIYKLTHMSSCQKSKFELLFDFQFSVKTRVVRTKQCIPYDQ